MRNSASSISVIAVLLSFLFLISTGAHEVTAQQLFGHMFRECSLDSGDEDDDSSVEDDLLRDFLKEGKMAFANGDYYGALSSFESALSIDPKNAEALRYKKMCEEKLDGEPGAGTKKVAPEKPRNKALYTNDEYGFSVMPPAGWKLRKSRSEIQFTSDRGECIAINMNVKVTSAASGMQECIGIMKRAFSGFSCSAPVTANRGGCETVSCTYTRRDGSTDKAGKIVYFFKYRFGFILFGDTAKKGFAEFEKIFDTMVKSFAIADLEGTTDYREWSLKKTGHCAFYAPRGTFPAEHGDEIARAHEAAFAEIQKQTGISLAKKISVFLYPDSTLLFKMTRRDSGFAIVDAGEVHSIWTSSRDHQSPGHEITHVITGNGWGEPCNALMGEGIAVYLDCAGGNLYSEAKVLMERFGTPDINDLAGDKWFSLRSELAYRVSGAFCRYMAEKYGPGSLKTLYQSKNFSGDLERITGKKPSQVMKAFKDSL